MDNDIPVVGMEVCSLTRKRNLIVGEVITVDTADDTYPSFTVEWSESHRTQYHMRAWRDTVSPVTCSVCDSETHNEFAHPL
jgi:hypothetical protein